MRCGENDNALNPLSLLLLLLLFFLPVGFKGWPIGRLAALMAVFLAAVAGNSPGGRRAISPGGAEQTPVLDATFASSLFAPLQSQELNEDQARDWSKRTTSWLLVLSDTSHKILSEMYNTCQSLFFL